MRTTVALDDELVKIAEEFTGITEKAALIKHVFKVFIERESARRLAALGGTMPDLKSIPRRRESDEHDNRSGHNDLD
jgi:Arc/MetJ family transcription regulator